LLAFDADAGPQTRLPLVAAHMLKLFHNIRASLHIPDQPPEKMPPMSGPGRNDAFGLLSAALIHSPLPYCPVKFGIVWNLEKRGWVHWDGNTPSPLARNILASLGLGAPMVGNQGKFDMKLIERQTAITEMILPPKYPYAVDTVAAARGKLAFEANCITCHTGGYGDDRLYSLEEIKTDPTRAKLFTQTQADGFNKFFRELNSPGFTAPAEGLRSTGRYYAPSLAGVWARSPYLHNGSVRTITDLLTPPENRPAAFHRGSTTYDTANLGFIDEGNYILDTQSPGNSSSGHDYGTRLAPAQKRDLIEYLKSL
jgi:mono/diheme cytochrome c family protein